MKPIFIPRIRGKVGQIESDDPKLAGKWIFEIYVSEFGGGEGDCVGQFGPWDTEAIAQSELRNAVRMCSEHWEKATTGTVSGKYVDLKSNVLRSWDKAGEN